MSCDGMVDFSNIAVFEYKPGRSASLTVRSSRPEKIKERIRNKILKFFQNLFLY